ncbi:MAG TPA: cytochrome c oxidase subunit II [Bryobacteraceae bacterium]
MHISVFDPASPQAANLLWLWKACMWVCVFIFAVVTASIAYMLVRYRQRDSNEPAQTGGNKKLEVAWTAIPIVLVTLLFVLSVVVARAVDRPVRREPDIVVTGHQWWWQVDYPAAGATTANEIHIPTGQDVLIAVESADVIHDFWVPRLGRKIDAIPGQRNFVWISAKQPGEYLGACAEFCGAQHAWMRFRVEAQNSAAYESWLAAQAGPAAEPSAVDATNGKQRFRQLTCANCHNINGVNPQKQYAPDLTHIAGRKMLAGELIQNTPENLRRWLREPNLIKPGSYMPNFHLDDKDLTDLTAYLAALK